ncbi:MAG: hypothetical protein PHE55_08230 [Methylococcaceae bacterium]|nr:hypothetical protein [Methylococcaceae bacterium]
MNRKLIASFVVLAGISTATSAYEIKVGGIEYVAKLVPNNSDLNKILTLKSDDDLGDGILMPLTRSMAWNDPAVNPLTPPGADGYGWAHFSKWLVLDLNKLYSQGLRDVAVRVVIKPYDNGKFYDSKGVEGPQSPNTKPSGDLIPALTVFKGYQETGAMSNWYPNVFQTQPGFWASKLTPFRQATVIKDGGGNSGYDTAGDQGARRPIEHSYDKADPNIKLPVATVEGAYKLLKDGNNYVSFVLGGDAMDAANKHYVNFQLELTVKKIKAGQKTGDLPPDSHGCKWPFRWHESMHHCMNYKLF